MRLRSVTQQVFLQPYLVLLDIAVARLYVDCVDSYAVNIERVDGNEEEEKCVRFLPPLSLE